MDKFIDRGPETIDGCDVHTIAREMVDLDVAFSPVVVERDSVDATEVVALDGGLYRVTVLDRTMDVTRAELCVMRARWLLRRGVIMRSWHDLPVDAQRALTARFFLGRAPWVAPKGSPLDRLARGEIGNPITIARDGDAPIDFAALTEILSTPGAEVPPVCPTAPSGIGDGEYAVRETVKAPPALEPPATAVLDGAHDKRCCHWKLNDPSGLDVTKLPTGLVMCREHWERVRRAQGGAFRRFGPQREYVGDRYR